jgi:methionyl-tRNA synthetase
VNLVNADLANSFGNAVSRCLNLVVKNCDGELQVSSAAIGTDEAASDGERRLRVIADEAVATAFEKYRDMDFVGACSSIMSMCTAANAYIDNVAPWTGFKSEDGVAGAARSLVAVLEITRIVAVGLSPVIPNMTRNVYTALGMAGEYDSLDWETGTTWGRLERGMKMQKPKPLFPRLVASAAPANAKIAVGAAAKSKKGNKQPKPNMHSSL